MKDILRVLLLALGIVLLEYALSEVQSLRLLWVGALIYAGIGRFGLSVVLSLLGGLLLDSLFLNHAGATSFSALIGVLVYVIAHSFGLTVKEWQKIIAIALAVIMSMITEFFLRYLLGESVVGPTNVMFWVRVVGVNTALSVIGILVADSFERAASLRKQVKL